MRMVHNEPAWLYKKPIETKIQPYDDEQSILTDTSSEHNAESLLQQMENEFIMEEQKEEENKKEEEEQENTEEEDQEQKEEEEEEEEEYEKEKEEEEEECQEQKEEYHEEECQEQQNLESFQEFIDVDESVDIGDQQIPLIGYINDASSVDHLLMETDDNDQNILDVQDYHTIESPLSTQQDGVLSKEGCDIIQSNIATTLHKHAQRMNDTSKNKQIPHHMKRKRKRKPLHDHKTTPLKIQKRDKTKSIQKPVAYIANHASRYVSRDIYKPLDTDALSTIRMFDRTYAADNTAVSTIVSFCTQSSVFHSICNNLWTAICPHTITLHYKCGKHDLKPSTVLNDTILNTFWREELFKLFASWLQIGYGAISYGPSTQLCSEILPMYIDTKEYSMRWTEDSCGCRYPYVTPLSCIDAIRSINRNDTNSLSSVMNQMGGVDHIPRDDYVLSDYSHESDQSDGDGTSDAIDAIDGNDDVSGDHIESTTTNEKGKELVSDSDNDDGGELDWEYITNTDNLAPRDELSLPVQHMKYMRQRRVKHQQTTISKFETSEVFIVTHPQKNGTIISQTAIILEHLLAIKFYADSHSILERVRLTTPVIVQSVPLVDHDPAKHGSKSKSYITEPDSELKMLELRNEQRLSKLHNNRIGDNPMSSTSAFIRTANGALPFVNAQNAQEDEQTNTDEAYITNTRDLQNNFGNATMMNMDAETKRLAASFKTRECILDTAFSSHPRPQLPHYKHRPYEQAISNVIARDQQPHALRSPYIVLPDNATTSTYTTPNPLEPLNLPIAHHVALCCSVFGIPQSYIIAPTISKINVDASSEAVKLGATVEYWRCKLKETLCRFYWRIYGKTHRSLLEKALHDAHIRTSPESITKACDQHTIEFVFDKQPHAMSGSEALLLYDKGVLDTELLCSFFDIALPKKEPLQQLLQHQQQFRQQQQQLQQQHPDMEEDKLFTPVQREEEPEKEKEKEKEQHKHHHRRSHHK